MNWPAWLLIGFLFLSTLGTIGGIGKERKPITQADASAMLVANVVLGLLVAMAARM